MALKDFMVSTMQALKNGIATLPQIYDGIDGAVERGDYITRSKTIHESARALLYRHPETFKKIAKGTYMLIGEAATSVLIEGDGRALAEIDDEEVDLIVTDHPWKDDKAHKSGNQKHFAGDYETFRYTQEDFIRKARVLKPGRFLVEFLPVESSTNWEYLEEIKHMAKDAGLEYYTSCIWRNAPEGKINTGKTTKGVQQILIFTKGKPRKLSRPGVNAYQTREILKYEIEILLNQKDKVHQAEKPIELYEYLVEQMTEEGELCLDQFGGSCNLLQAAVNKNRFAIVYEICHEFVVNAVERFHAIALQTSEFTADIGNAIYKKCIELAKSGWDGKTSELVKELPWVSEEQIETCMNNDAFCSLLKKNTGLQLIVA